MAATAVTATTSITKPATKPQVFTSRFHRHIHVRIRLCSNHCRLCDNHNQHEFTDVMDAERIDYRHVRITQPDAVWFGCEVSSDDYVIVMDKD